MSTSSSSSSPPPNITNIITTPTLFQNQPVSQLSQYDNTIIEIKSQLSTIHQQLSPHVNNIDTSNNSNTNNNNNNTIEINDSTPPLTKIVYQLEMLQYKLELQLQQQQLQLQQQQMNFEKKMNEQQRVIDQQQLELKQQQLELKQGLFQLNQQQMNFESEMKQKQLNFEFEMKQKQQQFDLQCERREFELTKRESIFTPLNKDHNQATPHHHHQCCHHPSQPSHSLSTLLFDQPQPNHNNNSITGEILPSSASNIVFSNNSHNNNNNNYDNSNEHNDIISHLLEDYQAMKYLVDQSTTTQQIFNNKCELLTNNIQQLQQLKSQFDTNTTKLDEYQTTLNNTINKFENEYQLKLNLAIKPIETTMQQHNNQLKVLEAERQEPINPHQQRLQKIEDKRKQVQLVLDENEKLEKQSFEYIIFQFENLSNVRISCSGWKIANLFNLLRTHIIEKHLKQDLEQYIPTIENSKLFISTKSILDGEWIQVQGDGKVVDITTLSLAKLFKPGDNIYDYKDYPCSKNCSSCKGLGNATTTKRFLIKIKWA